MKLNNDTIQVAIRTSGILKEFVKDKSVILKTDSSLSDLFNFMIQRYGIKFREFIMDPETNEISRSICILLNGETANNLNEGLADGDEVTLFVFLSGG